MFEVVKKPAKKINLPYVLLSCWFGVLLTWYFSGSSLAAKLALLSLGLSGLWLAIRRGEATLAITILGMGILLPSFKLISGLPHLRPEELLVLLWLCFLALKKQGLQLAKASDLGKIMAALMVSTVVSIIYARLFLHYSFNFRDVFELVKPLKYFLIVLLITNINFTELRLKNFMQFFWAFSCLFILFGFLEYFNPGNFQKLLLPYAPEKVAVARLASQRIMGLFGNPNYTGIFLMMVINLAFSFLVFQKNKPQATVFYLAIFCLAGMVLLLTMSRTALLAALISLGYIFWKSLVSYRVSKRQILAVLGIVLIVVALFSGVYGDQFLWRFAEGLHLDTSTSFQAKLGMWKESLSLIKQSPLFGWGPAKGEMTTLVDNEYLLIMRRYGLAGLLIYLWLYLRILNRAGQLAFRAGSPLEAAYGYGVQGMTIGFLIFNLTAGTFYNLQLMSVYFTLIGVLLALEKTWYAFPEQEETIPPKKPAKDSVKDSAKSSGKGLPDKNFHFVVLSHRFPTVADPVKGIYVQEQLEAILDLQALQTTIISPVPYAPKILWFNPKWRAYGQEEKRGDFRGYEVYYPRYPVIPGAARFFWQGISIFFSTYSLVKKISRQNSRVVLHAHTIMPDGLAALLLKLAFRNIRTICTIHGSDILIFPFRNHITTCLTRLAVKGMDQVVCVSSHLKTAVLKLEQREVQVVTNGVNPEKFVLTREDWQQVQEIRERWKNQKIVLFVGNLIETKGIKELLQSLPELDSNVVLLLVGRPYLRDYIEEFARQKGLRERVVIVGPVQHRKIKLWMQACDVLILPSYSEGMPVVMFEAMSLGKPVIISAVGGVPEVIVDGLNGILIPPRDVEAIKQALKRVLENPDLAAELGKAAQAAVLDRYTWTDNARQMLNIIISRLTGR